LFCIEKLSSSNLAVVNFRPMLSRALACAAWLLVHPALAEYRFDVWTTDSGLPQNFIGKIIQSRDGYLWMTTLDGLVRFDGVRFTVFNKGNSPGLPGNRLFGLDETGEGDLWISLEGGMGLVRYHGGTFETLDTRHGLPAHAVLRVSGDAQGHWWVIANNRPLEWKAGKFVSAAPEITAQFAARSRMETSQRGLLWSADKEALHLFSAGKWTQLTLADGLPSLRINSVVDDQHGSRWVATEEGALIKFRDGKLVKVYSEQDGLPINPRATAPPPGYWVTDVCEDRHGNIWLGGTGAWLGRLHNGVFSRYENPNAASLGQSVGRIIALFEDREGTVWIGTDGTGLIRARERVVETISAEQGLQAVNIYPICEDHTGAVWLGTWDKGLVRVAKDGRVENFRQGTNSWLPTALFADRDRRLWVGSFGQGPAIFESGSLTPIEVSPVLSRETVDAIFQDRSGAMWFGTKPALFHYDQGRLTTFTNSPGLVVGSAKAIIEDRSGALWIGTYNGLTRLKNGRFTTWTERDGLPSNLVRALYEDAEGVLWIGTYDGGLGRLKNGTFTRFTVKEGLFNNGVFQILEDDHGNLWMSSNRGIHRANRKELNEFAEGRRRTFTSVSYGRSDGMLNIECNGPGGIKARDGKLWFPTQDGVAIINPEAVVSNPTPPPVVIESLLLERESIPVDAAVRIPPGKSNIEIQYTALSFINSDRLQFKYRLTGVDKDWVEAGTRRTAYYSHVPPGKYTFVVLAANSDGLWNERGASLVLTILPTFYQTVWFRGLALVAGCSVMLGFFRRRIAHLEAERATQHQFSRRLIESQDAERKRIAAELHDSLGQELLIIKNRALLGLQQGPPEDGSPGPSLRDGVSGSADQPLSNARTQHEHLRDISQLTSAALQAVRDIAYNLRPYQLDQFGLTEGIEAIIRKLGSASGIHFDLVVDPIDGVFSSTDESHLFRIVQEATNNIVKHSGATEATVRVQREPGLLRVLIHDNGRGFPLETDGDANDLPRATSLDQKQGFGFPGMAERVRIMGGTLRAKSAVGHGTQLEFTLPIPTHG
jgi:signal transduction histidine kinase/ligand-binding sensor domain-containing protein